MKIHSTGLKRIVGMTTDAWLSDYVDDHLVKKRESRIDPGWFHPSELSTPCDRRLAFSFLGMPKKELSPSAKKMRIFHNGDFVHRRWQAYFRTMNILIRREVPVEVQEPPIRGHADAVIKHPINLDPSVVEIKSINNRGFAQLTGPRPDHFSQVNIYMGALGIFRGHVLYENKDTQDTKIYPVRHDKTKFDQLQFRLLKIVRKIYNGEVPLPYIHDGCSYCPYFQNCSNVGNSVSELATRWS